MLGSGGLQQPCVTVSIDPYGMVVVVLAEVEVETDVVWKVLGFPTIYPNPKTIITAATIIAMAKTMTAFI